MSNCHLPSVERQLSDEAMARRTDAPADDSLLAAKFGCEDGRRLPETVTVQQIQRAICCPAGACAAPGQCYAQRRDRDVPVRIDQAARAVLRLLGMVGKTPGGHPLGSGPTRIPLTSHKPGIVTIDYETGVPQDSAWQPQPDHPVQRKPLRV